MNYHWIEAEAIVDNGSVLLRINNVDRKIFNILSNPQDTLSPCSLQIGVDEYIISLSNLQCDTSFSESALMIFGSYNNYPEFPQQFSLTISRQNMTPEKMTSRINNSIEFFNAMPLPLS